MDITKRLDSTASPEPKKRKHLGKPAKEPEWQGSDNAHSSPSLSPSSANPLPDEEFFSIFAAENGKIESSPEQQPSEAESPHPTKAKSSKTHRTKAPETASQDLLPSDPVMESLRHPPHVSHEAYHRFWSWVENTSEYRALYQRSLVEDAGSKCLFCLKETTDDDYFSLCNSWRVHRVCYDYLCRRFSPVSSVEDTQRIYQSAPNSALVFRLIHTYWWYYPPDWEIRREVVIEASEEGCSVCGKAEGLDVYHQQLKRDGGNHALDNLICLCQEHQQEAHPWDADVPPFRGIRSKSPLAQTIELVDKALSERAKLSFHYVDENQQQADWTISPQEWVRVGLNLRCVQGYSYLQKDLRKFNPRRMSNLIVGGRYSGLAFWN